MHLPSRRLLAGVYLASGALAGSISYALGQSKNLEVFRHASRALIHHRELYDGTSVDWFKYSPAFALLFLPLALVPGSVAAVLWGMLNFGAAFLGIDRVFDGNDERARIALLAALPGVLFATDGDQANLLVGGAMLLAFAAFERNQTFRGAVLVALGALVKLFPILALLFAVQRRERERSLFRIGAVLAVVIALPLVIRRPEELAADYASWFALLRADHATRGWSLIRVARDLGFSGLHLQVAACLLLAVPLVGALVVPTGARFRRTFAAALLILIVLTNHRSEYTSFVLSAIGVGLWFADGPRTMPRLGLLLVASLAHGPFLVREDPVLSGPFSFLAAHRVWSPIRLAPLMIVWLLLQRQLFVALLQSAMMRGRDVRESAAE